MNHLVPPLNGNRAKSGFTGRILKTKGLIMVKDVLGVLFTDGEPMAFTKKTADAEVKFRNVVFLKQSQFKILVIITIRRMNVIVHFSLRLLVIVDRYVPFNIN